MSRIFEVVQAMSGQKNCIVIPGPYLDFFASDQQSFALAAVLNQLVFWTGKSSQDDGWFYKTHEELAGELRGVSEDQVQRVVSKLRKKYLPGVIEVSTRKVNGTPKNHYRIDGDKLIALIFPPAVESAESRNGKREVTESITQNHGMENAEVQEQSRDSAESYLYTDHYSDQNKQIIKPVGQLAEPADPQADDSLKIDYQDVLKTFHDTLPELPQVIKVTEARRKVLRKLWKEYDLNIEKWGAYLRYIAKKCRWMLEDRPDTTSGKTWRKKDFDYLITEKCYLSVKEERANDLPKVERLDTAARDDAYLRIVTQRRKPRNEVETIAQRLAGSLGRMTDYDARKAWVGIWANAVAQASENDLGRLAG
ncbi:Uncharacterised protein [Serratia proteamaculans]|uniref:hypothetical protein n=1 Tax=Serratia proteamaculans TaxID=28151 RepID=UPI002182951A|nr:hypothetical protein [Serratia proteamaculans]CAI2498565.1 Uncharacterised protein [Serratia proteamaculans]